MNLSQYVNIGSCPSLLFGVLLSYWYRYWPAYQVFCRRHAAALYLVGIVLLSPAFVFPLESPVMWTVGFTSLYLGSGAMLSAAVCRGVPSNRPTRLLARIGAYSYSIYLCHAGVLEWGLPIMGVEAYTWTGVGVYMVVSIVLGIVLARIIEIPCLQLRDRWFPAQLPRPAQAADAAPLGAA